MRNMNCRNVRREIEEAAPGDLLSLSVNDHLKNCVGCEKLSREQAKLQQIIASLGTIEAPGDFDFRLRARLAGEKRGAARPFPMFHLSVGRSAAVAAMLFLLGSVLVFVSLRLRSDNPLAADASKTGQAQTEKQPGKSGETATTATIATAEPNGSQQQVNPVYSADHSRENRRSRPRQSELLSQRGTNGVVALDSSSTRAPVLTRGGQLVETYPTSAFPIDAAYQSLKVSVDNGRGTSRTISLPTVSFGSNQSLSQSGPPLMAAARVAW